MPSSQAHPRFVLTILILSTCVFMSGCTPKVPETISAEEMAVHRDWITQYFADKTPTHLYLDDQTFAFDPLRQEGCGKALRSNDGVPMSLMRALHNLGNRDYAINVSPQAMQLRWPYQILNVRHFPRGEQGLHVISFSRVAIDRSGQKALFAVSDLCGPQCGEGHAISAKKENGAWKFSQSKTCRWMY